jgi:hypothetical protein
LTATPKPTLVRLAMTVAPSIAVATAAVPSCDALSTTIARQSRPARSAAADARHRAIVSREL